MRYLLLIPIFLFATTELDAARFDFTQGTPSVVDNSTCPTSRYDFSLGMPAFVYDATASCGAVATPAYVDDGIIWIDSD